MNRYDLLTNIFDAEHAVIGSMLIDPDCIPRILLALSPDDFISDFHRAIFAKIAEMRRNGDPVDAVTVAGALELDTTRRNTLAQILEITPTAANVDAYADRLKQHTMLFRLRELGQAIGAAVTLDEARELLDKASQIRAGRPGFRAYSYADLFARFCDRRGEQADKPPAYLVWPLAPLTEKLQAEPGNIIILGAYPGDGKTAFALQCAAQFAQKYRIGYFLFESNPDALYERHLARETMIDSGDIRRNHLTDAHWETIARMTKPLAKIPIDIVPAAGMTADDIAAFAMAKSYQIIFVDYLQLVAASGAYQREYDRVTGVSQTLQRFAARTETVVFGVSQLTRPEKSKTRTPTMSDLRSSGQIEQDADIILLMWREDYDITDSPRIIQIAKNRHGESMGRIRCHFDGEHQIFTRMSPRTGDIGGWKSQIPKKPDPQQNLFEPIEDNGDMPF